MYQRGVVCSDCHDSHTLELRAEGNAVCAQCHRPDVFDSTGHHHHTAGGKGAQCVECHMPARTYMVVDPRHDHAFKVPRPDVAAEIGAPDACTLCHTDKTQSWAAEAMDRFYGSRWRDRPQIATKVHTALRRGTVGARALLEIANDSTQPAIVRASAIESAGAGFVPAQLALAAPLLRDHDPGVRLATLALIERATPGERVQLAAPLLTDRVLGVRAEAAVVLADVPAEQLGPEHVAGRARGIDEYIAAQMLNADQPHANVNLGNTYARLGRTDEARIAYERALRIDPAHVPAYANLADLLRALGDETACDAVLARGIAAVPDAPPLLHVRGLARVRRGATADALTDLEAAARLDPANPRYAYVYGIALHSTGRGSEALSVLRRADEAHPYDIDILGGLVSLLVEAGKPGEALPYARKLDAALPGNPEVAKLLTSLTSSAR
jgi:Flp pilus assembly protein TadD